jgi:hypothetical protein
LIVKATDVFLNMIFRTSLQPYFKSITTCMTRGTFIKHKEVAIIYEESGLDIANYNVLLTQPESKQIA